MHGTITNSDLDRPCFAWHPYGKSGLFKTELVIVPCNAIYNHREQRLGTHYGRDPVCRACY